MSSHFLPHWAHVGRNTGPTYVCLSVAAQASNFRYPFTVSDWAVLKSMVLGWLLRSLLALSLSVCFPRVVEEITLPSDTVEGINFGVGCGFSFDVFFCLQIGHTQVFLFINFHCMLLSLNIERGLV